MFYAGNGKGKDSNSSGRLEASSSNDVNTQPGFLMLRDDVKNCEYKDVHVLWNILEQAQAKREEAVPESACSSETNKQQQHKRSWRAYFCSIPHHPTSYALLSS